MSALAHRTLVSAQALGAALQDPSLRLVDARAVLSDPAAGRAAWALSHLPGAVHADLERDLSDHRRSGLGRHPLPEAAAFAQRLGDSQGQLFGRCGLIGRQAGLGQQRGQGLGLGAAVGGSDRGAQRVAQRRAGCEVCKQGGGLRHGDVFRWFGGPNKGLGALLAMILGLLVNKCSKMVDQAE